jgi:FtsH-binding integral membrane protein
MEEFGQRVLPVLALAVSTVAVFALAAWELASRTGGLGRRAVRNSLLAGGALLSALVPILWLAYPGRPLAEHAAFALFLAGLAVGAVVVARLRARYIGRELDKDARYQARKARNEREAERMTGLRRKVKLWLGF